MKYVVFDNNKSFNKKSHELYNKYFKENPDFSFEDFDVNNIKHFIAENINNSDLNIVFYSHSIEITHDYVKIIDYFNTFDPKLKMTFFVFDYWDLPCYSKFIDKVFQAQNHYVVTFAENMEKVNWYQKKNYSRFGKNFIYNDFWCAYEKAFVDFNENPKNMIGLGGQVHRRLYPERQIFSKIGKYVERIPYNDSDIENDDNNFALTLNKYICCFTSPIYGMNKTTRKHENTHTFLLKVFEILASGSLLLYPLSEKKYIEEIGLIDRVNCILCDCSDKHRIIRMCEYVLIPDNRAEIDRIRKNGQEHARTKLNGYNKYMEVMGQLENLYESK